MYKTPGLTVSVSLGKVRGLRNELTFAEVAELVDALASGNLRSMLKPHCYAILQLKMLVKSCKVLKPLW